MSWEWSNLALLHLQPDWSRGRNPPRWNYCRSHNSHSSRIERELWLCNLSPSSLCTVQLPVSIIKYKIYFTCSDHTRSSTRSDRSIINYFWEKLNFIIRINLSDLMSDVPLKSSNQRIFRKVSISIEWWVWGMLTIPAVMISGVDSHHDLYAITNNK